MRFKGGRKACLLSPCPTASRVCSPGTDCGPQRSSKQKDITTREALG